MKFLISAITALFLMSFSSCGELTEREMIEGAWVTVERPFNTKEIINFGPDSSLKITKETELNASYKLEGDKLISYSVEPVHQTKFTDTAQIQLIADTLILKRKHHDREKITKLYRIDGNNNSIIGKWDWADELGRSGIITYKDGGEIYAKLKIDEREGHYSMQNDSLTFVFPGTTLRDLPYRFKEDTLFITTPDGKREMAHVRYKEEE